MQIKKKNSHMSKVIYKSFNLHFVCENTIQRVTTVKDYEYKVQFYSCGFFIMNAKMQVKIHCQKYIPGSQASSLNRSSDSSKHRCVLNGSTKQQPSSAPIITFSISEWILPPWQLYRGGFFLSVSEKFILCNKGQ